MQLPATHEADVHTLNFGTPSDRDKVMMSPASASEEAAHRELDVHSLMIREEHIGVRGPSERVY